MTSAQQNGTTKASDFRLELKKGDLRDQEVLRRSWTGWNLGERSLKLFRNSWTPLSCASIEMDYRTENHPTPRLATDWHTCGIEQNSTSKALKT